MNFSVNNSYTPNFGARLNLQCADKLLTPIQQSRLVEHAKEIGLKENVLNIIVSGTPENYTIKESHVLYAKPHGKATTLGKVNNFSTGENGSVYYNCKRRLENVENYCRQIQVKY